MAWIPLGHQQLAVPTIAAIPLAVPTGAQRLLLTTRSLIRMRDDGVAPTDLVGAVIHADVAPVDYTGDLTAVRLISLFLEAKVDVLYYG